MKLWLDDLRPAPEGWTHVYDIEEAKKQLLTGEVEHMSLDHDLGVMPLCGTCSERVDSESEIEDPAECRCSCHRQLQPTGYDLCVWMAANEVWPDNKPAVHSQNPVGRKNMLAVIERYFPSEAVH